MSQSGRSPTLNDHEARYISRAGWYSLRYPSSWTVEEDEECITFFDRQNGAGALQVSAYETPSPQNPKDVLIEYLSDHGIAFSKKELILRRLNGQSTASYSYSSDAWLKSIWFVNKDNRLLMITYNRKLEHQRREEEKLVERIVDSVTIETENSAAGTVRE